MDTDDRKRLCVYEAAAAAGCGSTGELRWIGRHRYTPSGAQGATHLPASCVHLRPLTTVCKFCDCMQHVRAAAADALRYILQACGIEGRLLLTCPFTLPSTPLARPTTKGLAFHSITSNRPTSQVGNGRIAGSQQARRPHSTRPPPSSQPCRAAQLCCHEPSPAGPMSKLYDGPVSDIPGTGPAPYLMRVEDWKRVCGWQVAHMQAALQRQCQRGDFSATQCCQSCQGHKGADRCTCVLGDLV